MKGGRPTSSLDFGIRNGSWRLVTVTVTPRDSVGCRRGGYQYLDTEDSKSFDHLMAATFHSREVEEAGVEETHGMIDSRSGVPQSEVRQISTFFFFFLFISPPLLLVFQLGEDLSESEGLMPPCSSISKY